MFALKKIVSTFLFPVALIGFCLGAGVWFLWQKDKPERLRRGRRIVSVAVLGFWLLGSSWVGDLALWPLLGPYPMMDVAALRAERGPDWAPDYLVVLGAGHRRAPELPPGLRLTDSSLARVNMVYYLHREFPHTRIICTGGKLYPDFVPLSKDMAAALQTWGVNPKLLITEEQARDTEDHVKYLKETLKGKSFILVTSATHMPRSMALFRHAGLTPIAAPALEMALAFDSRTSLRELWRGLVPSSGNFGRVERAAYEYLGLFWAKLRGQI